MNILIAGGTGLIGTHLVKALTCDHTITVISRDASKAKKQFKDTANAITWKQLEETDAQQFEGVINLSGHNIAASRWNKSVKNTIIDSRVQTNHTLIQWLIKQQCKPHYFSANAVGIYGAQQSDDVQALDEDSPIAVEHPKDFLNEVGIRWRQSVQPAIDFGIPVTITRFGVVLAKNDGLLKKLAPSFKLGIGSIIGDGQQVISWVHIDDVVRTYQFLLQHSDLTGSFNVTSPHPVSQKEFAKQLAHVLKRPLFLKTPKLIIRLVFGEMGELLINRGQRVVPKRLSEAGFEFAYPSVETALKAIYRKPQNEKNSP